MRDERERLISPTPHAQGAKRSFPEILSPWFLGHIGPPESDGQAIDARPVFNSADHQVWVSSDWHPDRIHTSLDGDEAALLLGDALRHEHEIMSALTRILHTGIPEIAGRFSRTALIVKRGTTTNVFSDAAGLMVVHALKRGSEVWYSSSPLVLRQLSQARVSRCHLAIFLAASEIPDVMESEGPFEQIQTIPPGYQLEVTPACASILRYWNPPKPSLRLSEGAAALRKGLTAAIERRLQASGAISCDMSGGFDSSALTVLAAQLASRRGLGLDALTYGATNGSLQDVEYAHAVATRASNVRWHYVDLKDVPPMFAGVARLPLVDRPAALLCGAQRWSALLGAVRKFGTAMHVSGQGADAVLEAPGGCYLSDLLRGAHVRAFLRHVRGYAQGRNEMASAVGLRSLRALRIDYGTWLGMQRRLVGVDSREDEFAGWGVRPHFPGWLSTRTVETVLERFELLASQAEPWSWTRGQHRAIGFIHTTAAGCRTANMFADQAGVDLSYPFLDFDVIEICLQVGVEERTQPQQLKPLLVEAFGDDLPPGFFSRSKQSSGRFYTDDLLQGFRRSFAELEAMLRDPIIGQLDLVRVDRLREGLRRLQGGFLGEFGSIVDALAAEAWLLAVSREGGGL